MLMLCVARWGWCRCGPMWLRQWAELPASSHGFANPSQVTAQGCSTLFTEGHRKYGFETAESGGVAVLRDCVGLIEPENIVGEASNSREDARIFSNARCIFA